MTVTQYVKLYIIFFFFSLIEDWGDESRYADGDIGLWAFYTAISYGILMILFHKTCKYAIDNRKK